MSFEELLDWIPAQTRRTERGCWEWLSSRDQDGYGLVGHRGKYLKVHRIMLAAHKGGPIDPTMNARHRCDNPSCCNPDHLDWGTPLDNQIDSIKRGRHARATRHRALENRP